MDELQNQLARLGLATLTGSGFALAGGYALQAHGLTHRLSEDIDLFTDRWNAEAFERAVESVSTAFRDSGFQVELARQAETFARLLVTDAETGRTTTVDLAADFRTDEPVALAIGPVVSETDAVAAKVAAVFSRAEARDYLDLADVIASGRYKRAELLSLGELADAGFDRRHFAQALAAVDRFPDTDFERYGVDAAQVAAVRRSMHEWSRSLVEHPAPNLMKPAVRPRSRARPDQSPERTTTSHEPLDQGPGIEQ